MFNTKKRFIFMGGYGSNHLRVQVKYSVRLWILLVAVVLIGSIPIRAEDNSKQAAAWIDRTTVSGMNILLQNTDSQVVDIVLLLKSGSGLDSSAQKGAALIMNQMVYFKLKYSKIKIGSIDVETYPDYSLISFKTTNSGLDKALVEVKDLLTEPLYSYDWITDLKGLYSTDLKGESPFFRAYNDFTAEFYGPDHPYNDRLEPDKMLAVSGKDVYQWYRKTYQPGNAILSITGKTDQSVNDLNKFFSNMNTESVDRRLTITPVKLEKDTQIDRPDLNSRESTITIGYAAPRFWDPEYPAFRVIAYYLNDYMHYFEELRVKEALFYVGDVYYNYLEKPKAPNIVFLTLTDPGSVQTVEARTMEVVNKLINEGISQAEIEQVIKAMKAQREGMSESEKNYAVRNALSQYLQTQLVYDENLMAGLSKVKTADIQQAAAKYFKHYVQVVYTPKEMPENF